MSRAPRPADRRLSGRFAQSATNTCSGAFAGSTTAAGAICWIAADSEYAETPRNVFATRWGRRKSSTGSGAAPGAGSAARIPVRGEQAIVRIEGRGAVEGPGNLGCRDEAIDCVGTWSELSTASLTARPAPGWKFERWEWQAVDPAIAPSFGATKAYRYTAVFTPEAPQTARR